MGLGTLTGYRIPCDICLDPEAEPPYQTLCTHHFALVSPPKETPPRPIWTGYQTDHRPGEQTMNFAFTITIEVDRVQGKFASRDEIEGLLIEAIEDIGATDLTGIGADGNSEYEISDFSWEVAD
jgi:hypothetical protein